MTTRLGLHAKSQRLREHTRKIRRHGACILIFQHQPNGVLKGESRDNVEEKIINSEKKRKATVWMITQMASAKHFASFTLEFIY